MSASPLSLVQLKNLVETAVAIRGRARLQPAGGPGDKVFPPTHSVGESKKPGAKYAMEERRIGGQEVTCVLLDSVQSQANRMEEALEQLWADGRINLPVIEVDVSDAAPELGRVTSLSAPHRVADAILRDSMQDGILFRMSEIGRSFTDATPRNADALFKVCPTGLVFGIWDSTGPKGGLGSKFARALVSEIVGIHASTGAKTSSRLDPLQTVTKAADVYKTADRAQGWTPFAEEARKDSKGHPVKYGDGKVSSANHSNIPPSIDEVAGGVTIDYAAHTVVLSIAALRKLRFRGGDAAAQSVLAALGLVAVLAGEARGHDLRSRCLLVPEPGNALRLEVVARDGMTTPLDLDLNAAIALYETAVDALPDALRFSARAGEPIARLTPSPKLTHLVKESRRLAAAGADAE